MKIIVTGGAGFIGSAAVHHLIGHTDHQVVNVDVLTYAANMASLTSIADNSRYCFRHADIADAGAMADLFAAEKPDAVMHLAAESHVDRSIDGPQAFIRTNIVGSYTLLEAARVYWNTLPSAAKDAFRFHHVSTDEVYGSLGATGAFTEATAYAPNSPYSASKAGSDHLVRAWNRTYGLPTLITNCSNNYGPRQFPEKLIPLLILNGLAGKPLPIYGTGDNVRDWLFVEDHARALLAVLTAGRPGAVYNIGGKAERTNIEVARNVCALLDELAPATAKHEKAITHVTDRLGHDARYAMDVSKIEAEIGWSPQETFATGLRKTVEWYLTNTEWWQNIGTDAYQGRRFGFGV